MRVADVMTRSVVVVSPQQSLQDAACRMDDLNVGALPVCDGNRLVGIATDRDITVRGTAAGAPPGAQVHEAMTDDLHYCFEDDPLGNAELEMARMQIRRLPVLDRHKRLVGILSLGDLATGGAPWTDDTLRSISKPSEPDRHSGRSQGERAAAEPDYWYD